VLLWLPHFELLHSHELGKKYNDCLHSVAVTGYSPENFLHNFISSHSLQRPSECNAVTLGMEAACHSEILVQGYYPT